MTLKQMVFKIRLSDLVIKILGLRNKTNISSQRYENCHNHRRHLFILNWVSTFQDSSLPYITSSVLCLGIL